MSNNTPTQAEIVSAESAYKQCEKNAGSAYKGKGFFAQDLRSTPRLPADRPQSTSGSTDQLPGRSGKCWMRAKIFILGLLYKLYMHVRDFIKRLWRRLSPKHLDAPIVAGKPDSRIVGALVHAGKRHLNEPIHNTQVVFWGRTWFFQWRKLAEGISGHDGHFSLPYNLRAARSGGIRSRKVEIYQTHYRYNSAGERRFDYTLFKSIPVRGSDLVGLQYDLRSIQLFFWEYRSDSLIARVVTKKHNKDAPQYYSQGKSDATNQQVIPIELIKRNHLKKLRKAPDSLSIQQIQSDYPINLTAHTESVTPGFTRSDAWFGNRMMNGMYAATFVEDETRSGEYWTQFFGICQYDHNADYAFPSVKIRFTQSDSGEMQPQEIQLIGPLTAAEHDLHAVQVFTPDAGEQWLQAKRVARVSGALATEMDDHLAGIHLVTEQYAIAAFRNLRLSPIAALLFPHLKEVILVNHSADSILVGPAQPAPPPSGIREGGLILWSKDRLLRWLNKSAFEGGYIPRASAMTAEGISQRTRDLMGVQDWKNWQPMSALNDKHHFAHSQNVYWDMLGEYVDEYFDEHLADIKTHWLEIYRFSEDLVAQAAPVYLSDTDLASLDDKDRAVAEERLKWYAQRYRFNPDAERTIVEGVPRIISPITHAAEFKPDDLDNLKALCRYCMMISTFMHSFFNEHQYEDIGEVLYNSLGLRFGTGKTGVMAPESDTDIAPTLEHATQMMWFSNLLSSTEYGSIERNEEGDINPGLLAALKRYRSRIEQGDKGMQVKDIESRTNI